MLCKASCCWAERSHQKGVCGSGGGGLLIFNLDTIWGWAECSASRFSCLTSKKEPKVSIGRENGWASGLLEI